MKWILPSILLAGSILLSVSAALAQRTEQSGFVKDSARNHPGWECPHHPLLKSFLPLICPICRQMGKGYIPYVRIGQWTCPEHPRVSSTQPGRCPLCARVLIKMEELERRTGKSIEEIDEALRVDLIKEREEITREEERARRAAKGVAVARNRALAAGTGQGVEKGVTPSPGAGLGIGLWLGVSGFLLGFAVVATFILKRRKEREKGSGS